MRIVPAILGFALAFALAARPARAADALPPEIASEIAAAHSVGLPTSALEMKAREGLAKGIPTTRIAQALGAMRQDLARARQVVGTPSDGGGLGGRDDALLGTAASALREGASAPAVARLAHLDPVLRSRALSSLADLLREGVSEEDALRLIDTAARARDAGTAFTGLATAVAALQSSGVASPEAVEHVSATISAGHSPLSAVEGRGPPPWAPSAAAPRGGAQ